MFATSLFLLPTGLLYNLQAYPINNPLWSLFFEFFANLAYAIQQKLRLLSVTVMSSILAVSGIALVLTVLRAGSIEFVGFDGVKLFLGGFVRVCYPFLAGVVIFRYSLYNSRFRIPSIVLLLFLLSALLAPVFEHSWIYDSLLIVFGFPFIVAFGARAIDPESLSRFWGSCGRLSYPLYVIHQPIILISYVLLSKTALGKAPVVAAILSLAIALASAYVFLRFYDQPLRNWLSKIRKGSRPVNSKVVA